MCTFAYRDTATAIAALSSAGSVVRVAEHAGTDAVRADIERFLASHVRKRDVHESSRRVLGRPFGSLAQRDGGSDERTTRSRRPPWSVASAEAQRECHVRSICRITAG
jgi:hypothetical protein